MFLKIAVILHVLDQCYDRIKFCFAASFLSLINFVFLSSIRWIIVLFRTNCEDDCMCNPSYDAPLLPRSEKTASLAINLHHIHGLYKHIGYLLSFLGWIISYIGYPKNSLSSVYDVESSDDGWRLSYGWCVNYMIKQRRLAVVPWLA